jgi:caffeoyl-CoA O-methyltransferase
MVSPPDSIAILSLLLKLIAGRVAVEVGVFTGYTSLGIASALPQDGKLYALDISEEYANIGKPYWEQAGVADRIDLRIAPAKDTLENLLQELGPGSVDLGFIDADKSNYDTYYELLLKLLRPGGVVVVDNVLWSGNVINDADQSPDTQAIRALNDKIFKDERVQPAMLKNSDGITVAVKL